VRLARVLKREDPQGGKRSGPVFFLVEMDAKDVTMREGGWGWKR